MFVNEKRKLSSSTRLRLLLQAYLRIAALIADSIVDIGIMINYVLRRAVWDLPGDKLSIFTEL